MQKFGGLHAASNDDDGTGMAVDGDGAGIVVVNDAVVISRVASKAVVDISVVAGLLLTGCWGG